MYEEKIQASRAERMHKAKDKYTGQWILGWYMEIDGLGNTQNRCCIARNEMKHPDRPDVCQLHEISEQTLCRCSGKEDAEGKLIWEHDVIRRENPGHYGAVMYGEDEGFYILWDDDWLRKDLGYWHSKVTVISNIFDKKEQMRNA